MDTNKTKVRRINGHPKVTGLLFPLYEFADLLPQACRLPFPFENGGRPENKCRAWGELEGTFGPGWFGQVKGLAEPDRLLVVQDWIRLLFEMPTFIKAIFSANSKLQAAEWARAFVLAKEFVGPRVLKLIEVLPPVQGVDVSTLLRDAAEYSVSLEDRDEDGLRSAGRKLKAAYDLIVSKPGGATTLPKEETEEVAVFPECPSGIILSKHFELCRAALRISGHKCWFKRGDLLDRNLGGVMFDINVEQVRDWLKAMVAEGFLAHNGRPGAKREYLVKKSR